MTKEIKIKKLSEYSTIEGIKILGRLNRAIAPYTKDKEFMAKLKGCFTRVDKKDKDSAGLMIFMEIVELITESAPELLFELVAILCEADKKDIAEANALDVVDAIIMLRDDVRLMDFLSSRFSLGQSGSASI